MGAAGRRRARQRLACAAAGLPGARIARGHGPCAPGADVDRQRAVLAAVEALAVADSRRDAVDSFVARFADAYRAPAVDAPAGLHRADFVFAVPVAPAGLCARPLLPDLSADRLAVRRRARRGVHRRDLELEVHRTARTAAPRARVTARLAGGGGRRDGPVDRLRGGELAIR